MPVSRFRGGRGEFVVNSVTETLASLPPVWPGDLLPLIRESNDRSGCSIVVLDDDPTGTQTVHDIPVLTEWTIEALCAELDLGTPLFYVLTNSRSLPGPQAEGLAREIGRNLKEASLRTGRGVSVISRSDSTLRGHYPVEVDALLGELGQSDTVRIIVPFFEEGGRFTIGDVHYVAEGDELIPAAETPFAKDASFGFSCSNLREWVEEKSGGRISSSSVHSVSIHDLRSGGPTEVRARLSDVPDGGVCVVNGVAMRDMEVFVAGLIAAEGSGKRFIARSAASFVRARGGMEKLPLLQTAELTSRTQTGRDDAREACSSGGLIVVGSYVPKTTAQLNGLLAADRSSLIPIEVPVGSLLGVDRQEIVDQVVRRISESLEQGDDVVLYTSRDVVTGRDAVSSLAIGTSISSALVEIVQRLKARPAFLIAKGGITSSDLATRGLGVKRAMVAGQILPGVPVWSLGDESRFPGMKYIVFPGNVGGDGALLEAYEKLTPSAETSV